MKKSQNDPLVEYTYRDHQEYQAYKRAEARAMMIELLITCGLISIGILIYSLCK